MPATHHVLDTPQEADLASDTGQDLYTISAGGFSATGDAFARDEDAETLWFLSMVGSQTALKAIWGSLLKQPPEAAHLIQGADGMALTGSYQRCAVPHETHGYLDHEDLQAAGLGRLPRLGLHQVGGVRLGPGPLPATG